MRIVVRLFEFALVLLTMIATPVAATAQAPRASTASEDLPVLLRSDSTGASLDPAASSALRSALSLRANAPIGLRIVSANAKFEVMHFAPKLAAVIGPEGAVRLTASLTDQGAFANSNGASQVADALTAFARQARLSKLATANVSTSSLSLRAAPVAGMDNCRGIEWTGGAWGEAQAIPLCQTFKIEARLPATAKGRADLYLLLLSSSGTILRQRGAETLAPGQTTSKFLSERTGQEVPLRATPPVNLADQAIAFAVPPGSLVDWDKAFGSADLSGANPITRDIGLVLQGRGQRTLDWTVSALDLRTIASDIDAGKRVTPTGQPTLREYTIKGFDITPYLPADTNSALFKVLGQASWLAAYSKTDGVPYKQHAWPGGDKTANDAANLKTGIDCSRSIWFAFTRAGLRFNRSDKYLSTAEMSGSASWMNDEFQSCEAPYRTGDILVYRDDARAVGHTVMVIDPEQRIAWGSHGWDGNAKLMKTEPDTGVEYQLIKMKKDWERWDTAKMTLRACWRNKAIARQWTDNPASRAGSTQISSCQNICQAMAQPVRRRP